MLASTWVPAKAVIDCTTQDTFFPINIEIGGSGGRRFPPAYQIRVSHSPQTSFPRWRNNSGVNRLGAPFRSILWARGRPLRCCRKKASSVFGRRMPSSFLEKKPSLLLGKTRPSSTLEKKTLSGPKRRGGVNHSLRLASLFRWFQIYHNGKHRGWIARRTRRGRPTRRVAR